ncbi:hypothetical protein B0H66DRAFT_599700 [Apodospora peruviana]|uniref:Zn(2)-C6 fungal-type domain-containing protein n=1 Tax=Apodospora peruviana TaxID=516989 RepID=A0AAE0IIF4_9PEZI|nr:hypothetical protein B0H66DRAFT_599700 [Apodospora peruviana]
MGIAAYLDHQYRLPIPDTPPEVSTPDSALSYSSRQFEERPWKLPAPVSPPMSNYEPAAKASDMSSGKGPDEMQARRDVRPAQSVPQQQLPSLSSLFGPPPARPLHSPQSDRPGPYPSTSPLDYQRGSPTGFERPHGYTSSSYFPPSLSAPSSATQPRSAFGPGFEDRPSFRSLPRALPGPLSPQPSQADQQRPFSHSDQSSGSKWLLHQGEYALGSRDHSSYRSPTERQPAQPSGPSREEDVGVGSGGGLTPQATTHNLPGTPASTVTSDGMPVKDGLGPKIWTGTHFLPRFVRAQEVPGEGLCYFYDDGSHCKTVIDGEAVNAHWGVTKAGKPRKRLAIACVTCREKKIKCDPDYPRCVQCEKFGRVCKFKNAPRGGHNTSPSTPPAEIDDTRRLGTMIRPPPPDHMRPGTHSTESASPRTALRPASPEPIGAVPLKRIRVGYDHFTPIVGPRSPMAPTPDTARSTLSWHQPELPRIHEDVLCRAWQTDPYVSDPQSVLSTISSFFVHTDAAALRFLPEKAFNTWVQSSAHRKSPEDQMLVYSILALGIALSGGPKTIAHEYSQVARYATEHSANSLQLVQARIILSLYYLSVSRPSDGNDMLSGAVSAATCLQLNLELDRSQDGALTAFPYGLTRTGYAECRRRTFWSCFIHERLNGLFPTRVGIINTEDVFIRLPTDLGSFEDQREVTTPEFEPNLSSLQQQRAGVGIMGYLAEVVAIWGDVMIAIYRLSNRSTHYTFDFGQFHHYTMSRLLDWKSTLPPRVAFSAVNLDAIAGEDQGTLILMHLVYHLTIVKLHRHIPHRFLTTTMRYQYAGIAREQARQLLDVVCAVAKESSTGRSSMPPPFTSFAILEAIDVLSAEGSVQDLHGLVDGLALARSVLEILGTVWEDAKVHKMAMDHRLDKLAGLRDRSNSGLGSLLDAEATDSCGGGGGGGGGPSSPMVHGIRVFTNGLEAKDAKLPIGQCWQMTDALETRFPREMDCVYTSLTTFPPGGTPMMATTPHAHTHPVYGRRSELN